MRLNYLSLLIVGLLICSGCTPASSPYAVSCENCNSQPYYSIRIIQPGMSSDFPVSYRVRLPEGDSNSGKVMAAENTRSKAVPQ